MGGVRTLNNGFLVVPFKLPSVETLKSIDSATHYMFVKKHQTKNEAESNSLFLVNLPMLSTLDSIKNSFGSVCSHFNTVAHIVQLLYHDEFGLKDIDLSTLTSDFIKSGNQEGVRYTPRNTALLQFVDGASVNNCWEALKKYSHKTEELVEWRYSSPSVAVFRNFYRPLDVENLKRDILEHMQLFEQREVLAQEEVQSTIIDEDGFTLVVGKNTKSLNSIRKNILRFNPLLKHSSKVNPPSTVMKKAKHDFYRFQLRERKKQDINELLKKFKQDQERVKAMKYKNKFNPYN